MYPWMTGLNPSVMFLTPSSEQVRRFQPYATLIESGLHYLEEHVDRHDSESVYMVVFDAARTPKGCCWTPHRAISFT